MVAVAPTNGKRIIKGECGTFAKTNYYNLMIEMKKQDIRSCISSKRYIKEKLKTSTPF